jgi:hypothetical protein
MFVFNHRVHGGGTEDTEFLKNLCDHCAFFALFVVKKIIVRCPR